MISRAGASDSSATPVMKARPRLPLCLSNYCAAAEGSFFILQEPWGDSTTLFADFGLFARASLSFFFSFWVSSFCTARRFNFDQGFQRSRSEASLFVHCVNMMSSGFSLSIGRNFTSNFYKRVRRKITNHSSFRHASRKILLSFRD